MNSFDVFFQGLSDAIINPLIFLLFAIALLYFVWTVYQYVRHAESGDKKDYRDAVLWALVGLFIMIGVFGIWRIVLGTFGIGPITDSIRR